MSDNKKQEKDFTKEVDDRLPEAAEIVKVYICRAFNLIYTDMPSYSSGW